jgi:periplasmic protein TonB
MCPRVTLIQQPNFLLFRTLRNLRFFLSYPDLTYEMPMRGLAVGTGNFFQNDGVQQVRTRAPHSIANLGNVSARCQTSCIAEPYSFVRGACVEAQVNISKSRLSDGSSPAPLQCCLIDGDPDQRARESKHRRGSLVTSIALQLLAVAGVVLIPLFGKPGRIASANITTLPPYRPAPVPVVTASPVNYVNASPAACKFCLSHAAPHSNAMGITVSGVPEAPEPFSGSLINLPGTDTRFANSSTSIVEHREKPRIVRRTNLSPSMLIHRVEPIYPTLARQMHRPGRVELRAIIAIDGTVESLQVVTGDPLFFQSALGAVRQWRYTPTILDGQPVEVDTYITVTYVLN